MYDAETKKQALALYAQGGLAADISRKFKLGSGTLYGWAHKAGITGNGAKALKGKMNGHAVIDTPATGGASFDARSIALYLKNAVHAMQADLLAGRIKKYDKAHLLTQLAYQELTGE